MNINTLENLMNNSFNKRFFSKNFINDLDKIYSEFSNSTKINYLSEKKSGNFEDPHNFLSYKKFKNFKEIFYNFKNVDVSLELYYNKVNKKLTNELVRIINFCITLFQLINKKNKVNNIKIYIFFINRNKFININRSNQLIKKNINSGYTQHNSIRDNLPDNYIVIYRTEEIKKVLIHELIHLYKFHKLYDVKITSDLNINNIIRSTNGNLLIYEAYTETMATIIYSYYYYKIKSNSSANNENEIDLNKILNQQLLFSFFQSAKILYNQKIYNIGDLDIKTPITINEKTSSTSYYILKCAILNNINLFKNLFNNHKNYLLISNYKINLFNDYLVKSLLKEDFKTSMDNILINLIKINKLENVTKSEKTLLKTFRMNILD